MRDMDPKLELDTSSQPGPTSVRLTVVQDESGHPLVDTTEDEFVFAAPHLLLREIAALCLLVAAFALLSHFADAPLIDIANPAKTPNPSKAPWYFLGLQELLHYYPPVVSGILLPGLAVLSLMVVPYFDVNVERRPFLTGMQFWRHLAGIWVVAAGLLVIFFTTSRAGRVWPLIATTSFFAIFVSLPGIIGRHRGLGAWIATRSLPFWIFSWFVLSAIVLTVIGTFFRGAGWSFVLPWEVGIHV